MRRRRAEVAHLMLLWYLYGVVFILLAVHGCRELDTLVPDGDVEFETRKLVKGEYEGLGTVEVRAGMEPEGGASVLAGSTNCSKFRSEC